MISPQNKDTKQSPKTIGPLNKNTKQIRNKQAAKHKTWREAQKTKAETKARKDKPSPILPFLTITQSYGG